MGDAHQVVVDHMREVIGGDAVRLQQDEVLIVLGHIDLPADLVGQVQVVRRVALRAEAQHIRLARADAPLGLVERQVAVFGPFAVIAEINLFALLLGAHFGKLLLRAEAGVRLALQHELLGEGVVDVRALPLPIGAVCPAVAALERALVEDQPEGTQAGADHFRPVGDLALGVGVLDAQKEYAARLVRQPFVGQRAVQITEMDKAGRAGRDARDLRALRQLTLGIEALVIVRVPLHVGKQQLCKPFKAHNLTIPSK